MSIQILVIKENWFKIVAFQSQRNVKLSTQNLKSFQVIKCNIVCGSLGRKNANFLTFGDDSYRGEFCVFSPCVLISGRFWSQNRWSRAQWKMPEIKTSRRPHNWTTMESFLFCITLKCSRYWWNDSVRPTAF